MKKKLSKTEAKKNVENFFKIIKNKDLEDIKKIKKLAMMHNITLKEKRKSFCKKCMNPYKNPKIRIKNKIKIITCENCGYIARWKLL